MRNAAQQLAEFKKLVVVLRACTYMSIKSAPPDIQAHPLFPLKHPRGHTARAGFSRVPLWDAIDKALAEPVALDTVASPVPVLGDTADLELASARYEMALNVVCGKDAQRFLEEMCWDGQPPTKQQFQAKLDKMIEASIAR